MKRKRIIDLENGEAYTYDKLKGFQLFDPHEFKYKGFDIKSLYSHYTDKKNILEKNEIYFETLKNHLKELGYKTKAITLYNLIEELINNIPIISTQKEYELFEYDNDGYIISYDKIRGNQIGFSGVNLPSDIDCGYYKIENGFIIKDNDQEERIWNFG